MGSGLRLDGAARGQHLLLLLVAVSFPALAGAEEEQGQPATEVSERAANLGIAVMLLGSVGFMMGLFYLVNQKDPDMKLYSWQVISSTISIFSSVLFFQAVNEVLEALVLEGKSDGFRVIATTVHMLCWFTLLQIALYLICEFFAPTEELEAASSKRLPSVGTTKEEQDDALQEERELLRPLELNVKCYAILLGHITGFASIHAFAVMQQLVPRRPFFTFLVPPVAWIFVTLLGKITDQVRYIVALADDKESASEKLWDEETEETEDDVIGLTVSFLFVQALRYAISGILPNDEGEEEETESDHSHMEVLMLLGMGFFMTVINILRTFYLKDYDWGRFQLQMRNVVAMSFAWCFLFSMDWYICSVFFRVEHGMIKEIVLALFVSASSFIMIKCLDCLADSEFTGKDTDQAIRAIVVALAVLIGFSWEKAFDVAVADVSSEITGLPRYVSKLLLAIVLVAVVVPAWRLHILPTILELEEQAEKDGEAIKGEDMLPNIERVLSRGASAAGTPLLTPLLSDEPKEAPAITLSEAPGASEAQVGAPQLLAAPEAVADSRNRRLVEECMQLQQRIQELEPQVAHMGEMRRQNWALEKRNRELQGSISGISKELSELQKLADVLAN